MERRFVRKNWKKKVETKHFYFRSQLFQNISTTNENCEKILPKMCSHKSGSLPRWSVFLTLTISPSFFTKFFSPCAKEKKPCAQIFSPSKNFPRHHNNKVTHYHTDEVCSPFKYFRSPKIFPATIIIKWRITIQMKCVHPPNNFALQKFSPPP